MGTTSRGAASYRGMLGLAVGRVAMFSKFGREAEQKVKYRIWDYTPGRELKIAAFERGDVSD